MGTAALADVDEARVERGAKVEGGEKRRPHQVVVEDGVGEGDVALAGDGAESCIANPRGNEADGLDETLTQGHQAFIACAEHHRKDALRLGRRQLVEGNRMN